MKIATQELTTLITNHWLYIQSVLEMHNVDPNIIMGCKYAYKIGMIKGYMNYDADIKQTAYESMKACTMCTCKEEEFHYIAAFNHGYKHAEADAYRQWQCDEMT